MTVEGTNLIDPFVAQLCHRQMGSNKILLTLIMIGLFGTPPFICRSRKKGCRVGGRTAAAGGDASAENRIEKVQVDRAAGASYRYNITNEFFTWYMFGMSGKRGKLLVFRQRGGKTIAATAPNRSAAFTEDQLEIQSKFKEAASWARGILKNPEDRKF